MYAKNAGSIPSPRMLPASWWSTASLIPFLRHQRLSLLFLTLFRMKDILWRALCSLKYPFSDLVQIRETLPLYFNSKDHHKLYVSLFHSPFLLPALRRHIAVTPEHFHRSSAIHHPLSSRITWHYTPTLWFCHKNIMNVRIFVMNVHFSVLISLITVLFLLVYNDLVLFGLGLS